MNLFLFFFAIFSATLGFKIDESLDHVIVEKCGINESCVRFCCTNESFCSKNEHFDLSDVPEAKNLSQNFKVLKGKPKVDQCFEAIDWIFLEVSKEKSMKNLS